MTPSNQENYARAKELFMQSKQQKSSVKKASCLFSFAEVQRFSQGIHSLSLRFHQRMNVSVHRDYGALVPHKLRERFYIYTAFKGAGGKGMP